MICSILRSPVLRSLQYMATFHAKSGDIYVGGVCVNDVSDKVLTVYVLECHKVLRPQSNSFLLVTPIYNP